MTKWLFIPTILYRHAYIINNERFFPRWFLFFFLSLLVAFIRIFCCYYYLLLFVFLVTLAKSHSLPLPQIKWNTVSVVYPLSVVLRRKISWILVRKIQLRLRRPDEINKRRKIKEFARAATLFCCCAQPHQLIDRMCLVFSFLSSVSVALDVRIPTNAWYAGTCVTSLYDIAVDYYYYHIDIDTWQVSA